VLGSTAVPASPPRSIAILGGLLAGIVVVALWMWQKRSHDAANSTFAKPVAGSGSTTTPTPTPTPKAPIRAPSTPELPPAGFADRDAPKLPEISGDIEAGAKPVAQQFADEARDPTWAPVTETSIKQRLATAPATLTTECRSAHCQIRLDGPTASVDKTIAIMESEKGLQGFAKQILLGKPESHADGSMSLALYVIFDRN
jgi:hypothetical protein